MGFSAAFFEGRWASGRSKKTFGRSVSGNFALFFGAMRKGLMPSLRKLR
jgi:hypothetical protein